jgi:hypothetical protein
MSRTKLTFEGGLSQPDEEEAKLRGYLGNVTVELQGGLRYRVTFYDPVRLAQTIQDDLHFGSPYFAEPGLIVVDEVSKSRIEDVIERLAQKGFFDKLVPTV